MKNKILDNLPTIFVCLMFIFGMTLISNHAKAEEPETWLYNQVPSATPSDKPKGDKPTL